MANNVFIGGIKTHSGKYYIEYETESGMIKTEHFDKLPKGTYFVGFKNGEPFYYEGKLSFPVMRLFVENLANDRIANYADKK